MPVDLLEFISKIIGSVAWPVVVLIIIFLFRREFKGAILSLTRLKYKDFEAEFGKKVEELEKKAKSEIPAGVTAKPPRLKSRSAEEFLFSLLDVSPRVAVIEAFKMVEEVVREAAVSHDLEDWEKRGVRNAVNELERQGKISQGTKELFYEMREVRDKLSHVSRDEISIPDARRYINTALLLAGRFNVT